MMAKRSLRFPAARSLDSAIHPRSWVIFLGESELVRASVLPIFVILAHRYDLRGSADGLNAAMGSQALGGTASEIRPETAPIECPKGDWVSIIRGAM